MLLLSCNGDGRKKTASFDGVESLAARRT